MEKVLLVKNGDLSEVNRYLQNGAKVKFIHDVAKSVPEQETRGASAYFQNNGDAYTYFVVEFD